MCGLAGIITNLIPEKVNSFLTAAEKIQHHRGPNSQGKKNFVAGSWQLGFCHQRLSILDLSQAGAQPMMSASGYSCIIYNGEVYNYQEIKTQLTAERYESTSDTEVLIRALEELGIEKAINLFNGMWAFAWFNCQTNKLYLCRDRAGIKPLYYYLKDNTLYFASEIKTILEATGDCFNLDYQVTGEFLLQSLQDTSCDTFYKEIKAVPAAHYIEIDLNLPTLSLNVIRYWDVLQAKPVIDNNLIEQVQTLFDHAVQLRLRSDVPVGVTLSGGLDSSCIATMMKRHLGKLNNLHILSAVAPGSELDESKYIDVMAEFLNATVHKVELNLQADNAIELLKTTICHNDSPVGSFSNIAHYLLMQKAHELGITVILSGQGADELLCGYKKYLAFYIQYLVHKNKFFKAVSVVLSFLLNRSILNQFSIKEAKRYLPKWLKKDDLDISGNKLKQFYQPKSLGLKKNQTLQQRQTADLTQFSVPFLTHYEDRMSMAWSREIRLPFLDYRLMELFINLPIEKKLSRGWTKYIFRQAMDKCLPKQIAWRKDKQGFINPQEEWLKKELNQQVINYFAEDALIFKLGLVNRSILLKKYKLYCTQPAKKSTIWYREIFNPLALEIWLQLNKRFLLECINTI